MAKLSLPPGFRFHPTDIELVAYYLRRKVMGKRFRLEAITEVDLYKFEPWDLPDMSSLHNGDLEWYFFCPHGRKYPNGTRINRTTPKGFWKASGIDRTITLNSRDVGKKKTLIYHLGKPPKGDRTDWVMYEYRLDDPELRSTGVAQDAYALCKIFQKSGAGPKIGEQYGAPFNEAQWDEEERETDTLPVIPMYSNCSVEQHLASVHHQPLSSYALAGGRKADSASAVHYNTHLKSTASEVGEMISDSRSLDPSIHIPSVEKNDIVPVVPGGSNMPCAASEVDEMISDTRSLDPSIHIPLLEKNDILAVVPGGSNMPCAASEGVDMISDATILDPNAPIILPDMNAAVALQLAEFLVDPPSLCPSSNEFPDALAEQRNAAQGEIPRDLVNTDDSGCNPFVFSGSSIELKDLAPDSNATDTELNKLDDVLGSDRDEPSLGNWANWMEDTHVDSSWGPFSVDDFLDCIDWSQS